MSADGRGAYRSGAEALAELQQRLVTLAALYKAQADYLLNTPGHDGDDGSRHRRLVSVRHGIMQALDELDAVARSAPTEEQR